MSSNINTLKTIVRLFFSQSLFVCCRFMAEDDSSTMLYLLSADDCNDHGDTELICAARRGDVAQCSTLLEAGADVNSFNENNSQTALLAAIESHHVQVVDVLLDYGADVQMVDNVGISPLYSAIRIKDAVLRGEMVGRLVSAGCDVNVGSQDHVPLFLAARLGALSVVKVNLSHSSHAFNKPFLHFLSSLPIELFLVPASDPRLV